jgi:drug/metabolite transporter (DMT)-like permease
MSGEAVEQAAGLAGHAAFGPIFILAWRFTLGGIVWMLLFPAARKEWTLAGMGRTVAVGTMLAIGLIVQHVGLDFTSEAVSAFLTSLTILFVPLLMTFALRKPPRAVLWLGVAMATGGVVLMTYATPTGFGWGELLGLGCALAFSIYSLAVNWAAQHETSWRLTGGTFITVGVLCFLSCALTRGGPAHLNPAAMIPILEQSRVWINVLLLAIFPTLGAFGILTHFQPRLDPTRAALIYLIEPIIALVYAMVAVHHVPGKSVAGGAALILVANVLVEILSARQARPDNPIVLD